MIRALCLLLALTSPLFAQEAGKAYPDAAAATVPNDLFVVPEGLEVTLWATSPHLYNPTNLDIDHAGRIWAAEGVRYRKHFDRQPEGDRIVVLEDTDGDGKCDKSHTFVQEPLLIAPLGVAVIDNQIVVSQPPHLLVYTDVDSAARITITRSTLSRSGLTGNGISTRAIAVGSSPTSRARPSRYTVPIVPSRSGHSSFPTIPTFSRESRAVTVMSTSAVSPCG